MYILSLTVTTTVVPQVLPSVVLEVAITLIAHCSIDVFVTMILHYCVRVKSKKLLQGLRHCAADLTVPSDCE